MSAQTAGGGVLNKDSENVGLVRYERGDGKPFVAWKVLRCVSHNLGGYKVVEERYPYTRVQWERHLEYERERETKRDY